VKPEPREYKLNKAQRAERLQTVFLAALDLHQRLSTLVKDRPNSDFRPCAHSLAVWARSSPMKSWLKTACATLAAQAAGSFRIGSGYRS